MFRKTICILLLCLLSSGLLAFASRTIHITTHDVPVIQGLFEKLDNDPSFKLIPKDSKGTVVPLLKYGGGNVITFNYTEFRGATERSRKSSLKAFTDALKSSDLSPQTQQAIFDELRAHDSSVNALLVPLIFDNTNADLYTALRWIAPFLPIIRMFFGVAAVLIVLLLIFSTVIDLAYIGLPFARELASGREAGGKESPLPGVSWDAFTVVKETESSLADKGGGYRNPYILYFRRRALTYIVLSICILYLVVGELGGLIGALLRLVDPIVR